MSEKKLELCKKYLRSTLLSNKGGIPASLVNKHYYDLVGEGIPYNQFNYSTLEDFLSSMPDVCQIWSSGMVIGVAGSATQHIEKMVSRQQNSKKGGRGKKSTGPSPRFDGFNYGICRSVGFSDSEGSDYGDVGGGNREFTPNPGMYRPAGFSDDDRSDCDGFDFPDKQEIITVKSDIEDLKGFSEIKNTMPPITTTATMEPPLNLGVAVNRSEEEKMNTLAVLSDDKKNLGKDDKSHLSIRTVSKEQVKLDDEADAVINMNPNDDYAREAEKETPEKLFMFNSPLVKNTNLTPNPPCLCGSEATMVCSQCKEVWYCSQMCQINGWPRHREGCGRIMENKRNEETGQLEESIDNKRKHVKKVSQGVLSDKEKGSKVDGPTLDIPSIASTEIAESSVKVDQSYSVKNADISSRGYKERHVGPLDYTVLTSYVPIPLDTTVTVIVLHVKSPTHIFVCPASSWGDLNKFQEHLQALGDKLVQSTLVMPVVGQLVLMRSKEDHQWYRGTVIKINKTKAKVYCPDFGFVEKVSVCNLKSINDNDVIKARYWASYCTLVDWEGREQDITVEEVDKIKKLLVAPKKADIRVIRVDSVNFIIDIFGIK